MRYHYELCPATDFNRLNELGERGYRVILRLPDDPTNQGCFLMEYKETK